MVLEAIAVGIAANAAYDISKVALEAAMEWVSQSHPELETEAVAAVEAKDSARIARVFEAAVGVILVNAKNGSVKIDGGTITALKGIKFNHQHGTVTMGDATVRSEVLVTGGSAGATGTTNVLGNTILQSKGTSIEIGGGASIVITGDAQIIQS
jgi:hypothetical protein